MPIADQMLVSGMSTAIGDIVSLRNMAGMVRACAKEGDQFLPWLKHTHFLVLCQPTATAGSQEGL